MSTRLAKYIKAKGIKQVGFAKLVGVPQSMVCEWVSGKRRPGLASALEIEKATGGEIPASYWARVGVSSRKRKAG